MDAVLGAGLQGADRVPAASRLLYEDGRGHSVNDVVCAQPFGELHLSARLCSCLVETCEAEVEDGRLANGAARIATAGPAAGVANVGPQR